MAERYYPRLPWDDVTTYADTLDHARVHADTLLREGIYGPYAQVFKWLAAMDNKMLIADVRVIGTLETA